MKIGFFQFRPLFGRVSQNLLKCTTALREVQADLVVLPELAFSGYYFRDRAEAMALAEDTADSPTLSTLAALCRERRLHVVTGFAEKKGGKCFNSAALIGPDGLIHVYRKLHLFNEEKLWFDPGDTPLSVQQVNGARIGMMICFDWVFPETARTLTLLGADILCHPSNLVLSLCQQTMRARSIENGVFTVTANRFGTERRPHGMLKFTGRSQVTGLRGELLGTAPAQRQALVVVDIDPAAARDKHLTPHNDLLGDRRPEFYRELTAG
jgi:predicted amidohydrolase